MTHEQIMKIAASDMNDSAQTTYTSTALLPYYNMALMELLEIMAENQIPITDKYQSPQITVPAGVTEISFETNPSLPLDLLEVDEMWESNDGGLSWMPDSRVDFIDPNLQTNQNISLFGVYSWLGDKIVVPAATTDIIVYLRYTRKVIPIPIAIGNVNQQLLIRNFDLFLAHRTSSLTATLIAQDEMRAGALAELASQSVGREINIPNKGRQKIATRRRPFRQGYKMTGRVY